MTFSAKIKVQRAHCLGYGWVLPSLQRKSRWAAGSAHIMPVSPASIFLIATARCCQPCNEQPEYWSHYHTHVAPLRCLYHWIIRPHYLPSSCCANLFSNVPPSCYLVWYRCKSHWASLTFFGCVQYGLRWCIRLSPFYYCSPWLLHGWKQTYYRENKIMTAALRDYYTLCKPRVVLLMLLTVWAGMYLASTAPIPMSLWINATLGIALLSGAAATLNHIIDQHVDALMERTKHRPIAAGRLTTRAALIFASIQSLIGFILFYMRLWML